MHERADEVFKQRHDIECCLLLTRALLAVTQEPIKRFDTIQITKQEPQIGQECVAIADDAADDGIVPAIWQDDIRQVEYP